jgi:hypothetical protein
MILQRATTARELRHFYHLPAHVYRGNPHHRATEESLTRLLVAGPTAFHSHADVAPYLLMDGAAVVGRCALIHDRGMPEYVQVAFFEALPGLSGVCDLLCVEARAFRPGVGRIVVGINGHLNYGAGLLLDHFEEPPVFGLPYTPAYYPDYFAALTCRGMISFRFSLPEFYAWGSKQPTGPIDGITVRPMNLRDLPREVDRYTYIDNTSFTEHPFWSARLPQENFELFHPFRHLMRGENLLFAERDGQPLGFILWYPDFNELVGAGRDLSVWDVVRYRCASPIKSFRLAEVALLPHARRTRAVYAMWLALIPYLQRSGIATGEGGFILEENRASLNMSRKFQERALGVPLTPYRRYGIFEGAL